MTVLGGFTALSSLLSAPLAAAASTRRHCLTVLYPWQPDVRFDFDYYRDKHLGMMREWFGASAGTMQIRKGIRKGDGSPPAFVASVTIEIFSMEGFDAATKEHIGQLIADVPNFSSVPPVAQIEEIVE
ncbi:MAG: EthD family reductase [Pseudomonadota bacterium]